MDRQFIVASDLDRTLIYSNRALALDVPDRLAPGCSRSRCTTARRSPS
ncbi:hypothetical protein ACFQ0T_29720 [Kitasatospora gansuensis]